MYIIYSICIYHIQYMYIIYSICTSYTVYVYHSICTSHTVYVYAILEHDIFQCVFSLSYCALMYMPYWNMLGLTVCCICHTGT